MPDTQEKSHGTQPPPQTASHGHPLPRRSSPEHSITLQNHRATRDASLRASAGSVPPGDTTTFSSPRQESSGDSHNTSSSDPNKWFDHSNKNPTANFESHAMDVDPPFFQKESDSSNEEKSFQPPHLNAPHFAGPQSSSADEYRSVIDDLTVEIQRLKDQLRRYKQKGPDTLRKDQLFEIKFHGLPRNKKRELEATLRDFAASLEGSPNTSSSKREKTSKHTSRNNMYSASGSMSKHASSSTGSHARPADSAYASMSTGANSSGTSLARPSMSSRAKSSEQKVESYLRDIPEGLYPRHVLMTDKERKKLVVRRLEQLFTGKISGRRFRRNQNNGPPPAGNTTLLAVVPDEQNRAVVPQPPSLGNPELAREARILPPEQQHSSGKKSRSRDNGSASNSNGDQTESGGNGNSSGSSHPNTSPTGPPPAPDQRPTRLTDLDPDRTQVPSENMDYIKHLGLVPPGLLSQPSEDVHPDAEGWVYLNLLCSLAQLHIINVTPDFVRQAVSEKSTKFQLSPDGRKIRWRGGSEGTKFSSDSSGENSANNSMDIDTDSLDTSHKRQKTGHSTGTGDDFQSGSSSKRLSNFGLQYSSSASFHYKPIFVHQNSSNGQPSMDETLSSTGPVDDSNVDDSRWGQSGSGMSNRRKRRQDGAIIYYSGAPFCTDLSGDPGDLSPTAYMLSSNQDTSGGTRPITHRSQSGSSLPYRPLSDPKGRLSDPSLAMDVDNDDSMPGLATDLSDDASEIDMDLEWSADQQYLEVHTLEPCGLGGVLPEDHFMVVVTTKRPKGKTASSATTGKGLRDDEITEGIIGRLASMSTSSPGPLSSLSGQPTGRPIEIEYVSGRIKRLAPVRLPPPAIFFPPFSTDTSADDDDEPVSFSFEDDAKSSSEELASRKANVHHSDDYPDGVDLSSGDEDGEEPENEPDTLGMYDSVGRGNGPRRARRKKKGSHGAGIPLAHERSKDSAAEGSRVGGSSAATANSSTGEMSS